PDTTLSAGSCLCPSLMPPEATVGALYHLNEPKAELVGRPPEDVAGEVIPLESHQVRLTIHGVLPEERLVCAPPGHVEGPQRIGVHLALTEAHLPPPPGAPLRPTLLTSALELGDERAEEDFLLDP